MSARILAPPMPATFRNIRRGVVPMRADAITADESQHPRALPCLATQQAGRTRAAPDSIDRTLIGAFCAGDAGPDATVIAQTRFIDAPVERFDPLQKEPVQLQGQTH